MRQTGLVLKRLLVRLKTTIKNIQDIYDSCLIGSYSRHEGSRTITGSAG